MIAEINKYMFHSPFTLPDVMQLDGRVSRGVNRIVILNVFGLPQTVADSFHTASRNATRPSSCVASGGVNWL